MSMLDVLAGIATGTVTTTVPSGEKVNSTEGTTSHVRILPYNATVDPQGDKFLPYIWQRMQKDDLVDYYFPGQKDTGFATFVRLFSGDGNVALVLTDSTTKQWNDTVAGFITWTPMHMGLSNVLIAGFVFFREFWDHHTTDDAGAAAFRFWFKDAGAELVMGVCPSLHTTAIRYNKRIGLHEMGRIPGAHLYKETPCDAILVGITRDEWRAR